MLPLLPSGGCRLRLALPCLVLAVAAATASAEVSVTYLANEGVLIDGRGCKVLVDALVRDSLGDYVRHTAAVQEGIETARPPFDRVSLLLATHFHLDHWDPGAVSRHLRANPDAVFAAPPTATAMFPFDVRERVRPLWPAAGAATVRLEAQGAVVDALPLDHGAPVENLAYRISCGDRVLVHLGDAAPSASNFARLAATGAPDVALLPFWWLLDDAAVRFVKDVWKPRHVVALHLGASDMEHAAGISARLPGTWVCTEPGAGRVF